MWKLGQGPTPHPVAFSYPKSSCRPLIMQTQVQTSAQGALATFSRPQQETNDQRKYEDIGKGASMESSHTL